MEAEHFFRDDGFGCFHDLSGGHHGNGLDEKVHVILVGSNFEVPQFVTLFDFEADILEGDFRLLRENIPTVFGRTDEVVEKECNVMALVYVLADGHARQSTLLHA
jgi:hypothetical protein